MGDIFQTSPPHILMVMSKQNDRTTLILDTPNILFYHLHRGKQQVQMNLFALILLVSKHITAFATLTPKMENTYPAIGNILGHAVRSQNGKLIPSGNTDPDLVVLELGEETSLPILSNDNYRQEKYKSYSSRNSVIHYEIINGIILPRKQSWKNLIYGGE